MICRYAEILLNYAEALNGVDFAANKTEVCNLLDQIRHRAGITGDVKDRTDLTHKRLCATSSTRRAVELAFEEHRSWDVRRWNVAEQALGRDIYGVDVTKKNRRMSILARWHRSVSSTTRCTCTPASRGRDVEAPSTFENDEIEVSISKGVYSIE